MYWGLVYRISGKRETGILLKQSTWKGRVLLRPRRAEPVIFKIGGKVLGNSGAVLDKKEKNNLPRTSRFTKPGGCGREGIL